MFSLMPEVDDSLPVSEVVHINKRPIGIRTAGLGFRAIAVLFTSGDAGFGSAKHQE
jgi:hypothetical protein